MNLHRASNQPEWAQTAARDRTYWQRLAATTGGIITPPNAVTIAGLFVVLYGLAALLGHRYWIAFVCLGAGRLLDIVDGWLAELTHTKSPLGETLDASVDKIGTFLTIVAMLVARTAPWWILMSIALPQIIISGIVLYNRWHRRRIHPSRVGKLSMAVAWASLFGLVLAKAVSGSDTSLLAYIFDLAGVISAAMGLYAAVGYIHNHN